MTASAVIDIEGLKNFLGGKWVHDGLDMHVDRSELVGIIGASGCGKTTLLRSILMLHQHTAGSIKVFGIDNQTCGQAQANRLRQRWGMMFQSGALFSSLTLIENVMFPLMEYTDLSLAQQQEVALLKIAMVGLELDAAFKLPSELSGGMRKRGAMARALALDPELLFLDEPTAGLDPDGAGALDDLILHLRDNLNLTFVIVTHDLDTLWHVTDRVVYLGEGKVLASEPIRSMMRHEHPMVRAYFAGPRAQLHGRVHDDGH